MLKVMQYTTVKQHFDSNNFFEKNVQNLDKIDLQVGFFMNGGITYSVIKVKQLVHEDTVNNRFKLHCSRKY